MNYIKWPVSILGSFLCCSMAMAKPNTSVNALETGGIFVGGGGAVNWLQTWSHTSGVMNVVSGFPPLGIFSGKTGHFSNHSRQVSPEVQVGYFAPFTNTPWLWGLNLSYQFSHNKSPTNFVNHEKGTFINVVNPNVNVVNQVTMQHVTTTLNHELMLPVFLGRSFASGFVYLGGGPVLFNVRRQFGPISDNLSGYYIGKANGFNNTRWLFGGGVQTGLAYFINATWFLKLNYTYAASANYSKRNQLVFGSAINKGLNNGTMTFMTSQRLATQAIGISINKLF